MTAKWAAGVVCVGGLLAACASLPSGTFGASRGDETGDISRNMRAHMTFLADDALQGREPGTPGFDIAANYVAAQFAMMGLEPGGDDGSYFQPVTLRTYERIDDALAVSIVPDGGRAQNLTLGEDFYMYGDALRTETDVTAHVVFVGYGVDAPELGVSDYEGLDVEGKIVAVLAGSPPDIDPELASHFGSGTTKRKVAAGHGAIGYVAIFTPALEKRYGFQRAAGASGGSGLTWVGPDGAASVAAPGIQISATLSMDAGEALFDGAGVAFADVLEAAAVSSADVPRMVLPVRLRMAQGSSHSDVDSVNVVGVLPGTKPELAGESVVLTAHLDHIGVGTSGMDGDYINNGAMDNSAGTSAMLEAARLAVAGEPLDRTTLFVSLTAEESGLIGAEYFVNHPPKSAGEIVANVNLDMPILLYDFVDVTAFGAERSTLGPLVEAAAGKLGVTLSPDPMPEQNLFVRSDHYRFVQAGIPSVFLVTGFANGGEEAFQEFLGTRYHRPNDDLSAPIDFSAGAKFARVNYEILVAISGAAERPKWRAGDFFGTLYGGPMEEGVTAAGD